MTNMNYEVNVSAVIFQLEKMMDTVSKTMSSIDKDISSTMKEISIQFMDTANNINILNDGMNSFDATQKIITSSIGVASAALSAMNGAILIAETSQEKLNLTILKNPYVLAAAAIAALVAGLGILASSMSDEVSKHQETMDAINAEITARNDLHAKQQESLTANLAEISNVDSLHNELKTLVDANGEVSEANRDRASFITTVLNEALGTQMKVEKGVLKGYDNANSAIDNKIAKLKAEAILEAQLPAYKEALINATNAQIEADRLESELSDINMQKKAKEAELIKKYGENWRETVAGKNSLLAQELKDLDYSSKMKEEEYNKQNELAKGYYDDISLYETNAALIASGNADNYKKVQMESAVTKAESVEEKKLALESEIEAEAGHIERLQELRALETDAEKQQELDNQIAAAELKQQQYQNDIDEIAQQGERVAEAKQINNDIELAQLETFIADKQAKLTDMYATDESQWTDAQREEAEKLQNSINQNLGLYTQYASDKVNKSIELTQALGENATEEQRQAAETARQEAASTLQILGQNAIDKLDVLADLKQKREAGDKSITDSMIKEAERQAVEAESKYGEVASKIEESWENLPKESQETFQNVMEPMISEMEKKEPSLFEKANGIASGILGRLKKAFDINSPSKKVKKIFESVMEGAEVGLDNKKSKLLNQTEEIATDVIHTFSDVDGINTENMISKMKSARMHQQLQMVSSLDGSVQKELSMFQRIKVELPELKGTFKGKIENHIDIDGRETAIQLAPFMSEELAFLKG